VGIGDAILDTAGHIPIGIIRVCVRRSRFGVDACDRVWDARAVLIRPREPAGLIGGCRIVHAGVGQCADVGESARFEIVKYTVPRVPVSTPCAPKRSAE